MEALLNATQLAVFQTREGNRHAPRNHITKLLSQRDEPGHIAWWVAEGRPVMWCVVEEAKGYTVAVDFAYGNLALFKGDKLLGCGINSVIYGNVMAVEKEYYGTPGYIYFHGGG